METKMKLDKNSVAIIFGKHGWGNRKKADMDKVETETEKAMLSMSKKLIDSEQFRTIKNYQMDVRRWINAQAVPSFYIEGCYLLHASRIGEIEARLREHVNTLREMVEVLIAEYEDKIVEAEARLKGMFKRSDYPTASELRNSFYFEWKWVKFDIPDTLPKKIFEEEKAKAEKLWASSVEQISLCLRESFAELIKHAAGVLEPDANGRQKGWKDSSFNNVKEFITTFNSRNLINDVELQKLVEKADKVLSSIEDPQELKRDDDMREVVQKNFNDISKKLGKMIVTKPSRKFDLE